MNKMQKYTRFYITNATLYLHRTHTKTLVVVYKIYGGEMEKVLLGKGGTHVLPHSMLPFSLNFLIPFCRTFLALFVSHKH